MLSASGVCAPAVYPHLGRFQRRQFVTTALRALGICECLLYFVEMHNKGSTPH